MVRLIVFLGNPGPSCRQTRHNAGFILCERLFPGSGGGQGGRAGSGGRGGSGDWREKFNGLWTQAPMWGRQLFFLKPGTFMNRSGESVSALSRFHCIAPEEMIVVHDELELPLGGVSLRFGGGTAGHNGLRSIQAHAGTPDFFRLRIGISRPARGTVSSYVLSRFSPEEEILLPRVLAEAESLLDRFFGDEPADPKKKFEPLSVTIV